MRVAARERRGRRIALLLAGIALAAATCLAACTSQHADGGSGSSAGSTGQSAASTPARPSHDVDGELVVRFIDVGQGDCALLSCDGHHLLIDGGPRDASRKVYSIVDDLGIKRLDAIIATHPDADHIGGLSAALNAADCDVCYCSTWEVPGDLRTFSSLVETLERKGVERAVPAPGDSFGLGGATVTFMGPASAFEGDNDNSLVCAVDFGSTSFLFTGDMEAAAEDALVASRADLHADVLKVAHHGSRSSSTPAFLHAVHPAYAVISVGAGNDYGHPKQQTLDRLAQVGATIYRTDRDGSVIMKSDGDAITVSTTSYVDE